MQYKFHWSLVTTIFFSFSFSFFFIWFLFTTIFFFLFLFSIFFSFFLNLVSCHHHIFLFLSFFYLFFSFFLNLVPCHHHIFFWANLLLLHWRPSSSPLTRSHGGTGLGLVMAEPPLASPGPQISTFQLYRPGGSRIRCGGWIRRRKGHRSEDHDTF